MELLKNCVLLVSALFPIVNPLGGSPIFLTLTQGYSSSDRKLLSSRIAVNSFILLIASYLVGSHVLAFFGVSLPIVQVGGGLVVIASGWAMLHNKEDETREGVHKNADREQVLRHAFYPLTLPLTVGPGSISVAITLGANAPHPGAGRVLMAVLAAVIASFIIALSVFVCYGFADRVAARLGPTGLTVILRLSAFLLLCIGLQILWNGVSALLHGG